MSSQYPDPPTWAPIFLDGPNGLEFNTIWLQWFQNLAAFVTASGGGGGGAADHESLAGLLGGSAAQHYHTTNAQYTELVGNKAAHLVYAGPSSGGATAPAFRALVPGDIPTGAVVAFGLDGESGEDGLPGINGQQGQVGQVGAPGMDGLDGESGEPGMVGATGATGADGAVGSIGMPGFDGDPGEDGLLLVGPQGATGATGAAGADGVMGPPGVDGEWTDAEELRGYPSGDPVYAPFMQVGAALNYLKVETVVNLTVPVDYSLIVAGDYVVDGNLTINGEMRILG